MQVTKHDDVFMLDGEGMPTVGNPFVKGRLFVIFKASVLWPARVVLLHRLPCCSSFSLSSLLAGIVYIPSKRLITAALKPPETSFAETNVFAFEKRK